MWDPEPERATGMCASCGLHTDNGIVHVVPRVSGPDVRLVIHADPDDCPAKPRTNTYPT